MTDDVLVLAYAGCTSCKSALKWLEKNGVRARVRPIVDEPPTTAELLKWIPASGVGVRKWLNTSGQSYRAIGREKIEAANEGLLARWLTEDGKLVKRPVLVRSGKNPLVLVGFKEDAWAAALGE